MPTRLGMGQFGKARPQWKEIASGYAVIRPESVASVTEVCNFPEADFWPGITSGWPSSGQDLPEETSGPANWDMAITSALPRRGRRQTAGERIAIFLAGSINLQTERSFHVRG
jgi:hypothetical protein